MARVDQSAGRRARDPRTAYRLAASLAVALTVAAMPGWATAAPVLDRVAVATTEPTEPGEGATEPGGETPTGDPTSTGPVPTSPPPTTAEPTSTAPTGDPAPTTTRPPDPAPATTAPTTAAPTTAAPPPPPPPVKPTPPGEAAPLGVTVSTGDVVLTSAYWNARSTVTTLRVTITNTGGVSERIGLAYTLPAGITDAGTAGCAATGGGGHQCGAWTSAPGSRFSTDLRLRVSRDAWRRMPLSGSVQVTATAPGAAPVSDNQGFAVLFPSGPPAAGIKLEADEVAFDMSGAASALQVRLGNTGSVDASGRVEVVLPAGVTVPTQPPGCVAVDPTRTRCTVGIVRAGRTSDLRLPVTATPEAQRDAPLAGAVVGELDPRSGKARQVRLSFRIVAAAALATPVASPPGPEHSQGVRAVSASDDTTDGMNSVQRTAMILIAVSSLLVVAALALATTSLRRRMAEPVTGPVPPVGRE
ncbi:hypothetical protein GKC29_01180 [Micromonospora sp. WMMC415]|uniref:hypothetical protein n=1 Tax=Micromonospora sp. WMMC415 TaxID=2675222 RepID=UPI0012B448C9|nr:hypothetical protein [Micromonospora sp. WMMC415]QGN45606.1 hypothetical protein GKC29_01180 [Micromonospora sp. WMMC415]